MDKIIEVWKESLELLKKYPRTLVPFALVVLFETLALYILFLTPQRPVAALLAPPVNRFFGEQYLHYPYNLFLLPKLFYYAQILIGASIGILMTGMALGMIKDAHDGKKPRMLISFVYSLKHCLTLLGIWIVMFSLSYGTRKLFQMLPPDAERSALIAIISYFVALLPQIVFIYAMPSVIINNKTFIPAIRQGVVFFAKHFVLSLALVLVPALIYLPVIAMNMSLPVLSSIFPPEIIVAIVGLGIAATCIIDIFVTTSPALVLLQKR